MHGIETIKKINQLGHVPITRNTTYPRPEQRDLVKTIKRKIVDGYYSSNFENNTQARDSFRHTIETLRLCETITEDEYIDLTNWNDFLWKKTWFAPYGGKL